MMSTQPARGMRDFLPEDVRRREYVVGIIRGVYDRYGFEPLETPAVENIETLLGKYGDEGNKLIFKILMRGEHEASGQADLALRYDLTVPLARVVAEYQSKLPKIFKRYQIQPVWRADRPARGRFREFYQCDIDSVGSASPAVEADQISAAGEVLQRLGFSDFKIALNHRGILTGLLEANEIEAPQHETALVALDKLDKIGDKGVEEEFANRGIDADKAKRLMNMLRNIFAGADVIPGKDGVMVSISRLGELDDILGSSSHSRAVRNLGEILKLIRGTFVAQHVYVDPRLARGLSYYTGGIMEITVPDLPGSLGGGGRYDNLVGAFLGKQVPACGFSLGLERILVVMGERQMFPKELPHSGVDFVVTGLDEGALIGAAEVAQRLRALGQSVDLYPDAITKFSEVFKYLDQRRAKWIVGIRASDIATGVLTLRDLRRRTNEVISTLALLDRIKRERDMNVHRLNNDA